MTDSRNLNLDRFGVPRSLPLAIATEALSVLLKYAHRHVDTFHLHLVPQVLVLEVDQGLLDNVLQSHLPHESLGLPLPPLASEILLKNDLSVFFELVPAIVVVEHRRPEILVLPLLGLDHVVVLD